jgi:hypothetical protein
MFTFVENESDGVDQIRDIEGRSLNQVGHWIKRGIDNSIK